MNKSRYQILITGSYRSGRNFFTHLLNCHPLVSSTIYRVNYFRFIYGRYNITTDKEIIIKDLADRLFKRYKIKINKKKFLNSLNNNSHGEFYDSIMSNLYLHKNKKIWAETCALLWRKIPNFMNLMNNPKAIHIIRDPRAVILSFKKETRYKPPAYLGSAFNSVDAMNSIIKHKKMYKKRFTYIRYEDLVKDKVYEMKKIFKFLNIYPITKYNQNNFKDEKNKKWIVNSSFQKNILKPFDYDYIQGNSLWKKKLSFDEINFVETICEKYMNYFGYKRISKKNMKKNKIQKLIGKKYDLFKAYKNWDKSNHRVGFQRFPANPLDGRTWNK